MSTQAVAKQLATGVLKSAPGLLWASIKGFLVGGFLFGVVGLVIAALPALASHFGTLILPTWLLYTTAFLAPIALGIAGAYIGFVRGFFGALVAKMIEAKLVERLYARMQPHLRTVVASLRARSGPLTRSELVQTWKESIQGRVGDALAEEKASSLFGRMERYLITRWSTVLCAMALQPGKSEADRTQAIADVETLGVGKVEEVCADAILGLYLVQCIVAVGLALLAIAVPFVVWALER